MYATFLTLATMALFSQAMIVPPHPSAPGEPCETGRIYYKPGDCPTGYVGCAPPNADMLCPLSAPFRFNKDCGPEAYNLGTWYECASNGYFGCNTIQNICDLPIRDGAIPKPKPKPDNNSNNNLKFKCPSGTNYFGSGVCPSGYVGCLPNGSEVCLGQKRFNIADCPQGTGFFMRCANGFVGCSTSWNMCG
jgi:hypothetical protein